ncbi:MAG TPA: DUF4397 domain-containing protein [Gemmatimonadaceae bacterium]|jgi:hypothetical protein|nr:DUF4397 domain-containing protein [Gemmatimonadaceae bacterium]
MRRILQLSALCIVAAAASACSPDTTVSDPVQPFAGVRFINAVPDTAGAFGLDFRFVDIVENSDAFRITFRNNPQSSGGVTASQAVQYKAAQPGSRHFRVFLDDTLQSAASTVLADSTATLEANHLYTFLLWGNARSTGSDKMRLTVIDETVADPGTNVALRVINASGQAVDVRQYASSLPASATWANVAPYTVSSYVTTPPATLKFDVQPAGGGTALFSDITAIPGQPAGTATGGCTVGVDCTSTPGTTVAGSAVTLIVFPRSVAGSRAASFTTMGGAFVWDRRPTTTNTCTVSFGC